MTVHAISTANGLIRPSHVALIDGARAEQEYSDFGEFLIEQSIWAHRDHPMKYQTYFKSGGRALYLVLPRNARELALVITRLHAQGLPYRVIGQTSNIMFFDEIDYGVIISTANLSRLDVEDRAIRVEAGYSLQDFVRIAIQQGSHGFEGLEGIPGTVGGGIFMNAGAYGSCISDHLLGVDCIAPDGSQLHLTAAECGFSYRTSAFRSNDLIIVAARFALNPGDRTAIYRKVEAVHIARHSYQEFVYPTLGSMISFSGDMYRQMFRKNAFYRNAYGLAKLALKNPVIKFAMRKRPNNGIFNALLRRYISSTASMPDYEMSIKTANTLVNDGRHTTAARLAYMRLVSALVGPDHHIENELVIDVAISVEREFQAEFAAIRGTAT